MIGESVLFCVALLLAQLDQSSQYGHGHSSGSISGSNAQSYSSASASSFSSAFSSSGSFSGSGSGNDIAGPGFLGTGAGSLGSAGSAALAGAASFANAGAHASGNIPAFGSSYSGTKGGSSHKAQAILKKNGLGVGGGIGLGQGDTLLGTSDFGSAAIKSNCAGKPCTQLGPELGTGHLPLESGPEALESGGLSDYASNNKNGIGPFKPNGYNVKTNSGAGVGGGIGIGAADTFLGGGVKVNGGCGSSGCGSNIKPVVEDNLEQGGGISCVGAACLQNIPQQSQNNHICKHGGCTPGTLHFPGEIGGFGPSSAYDGQTKPGSTGYVTGNVVVSKPGQPDTSIHFQTAPENVHGISSSVSGGISSDGPGFATGSVHITKPGGSIHHNIPSTSQGSGNVYVSKPIGCGQNSDCSGNVPISYPTVPEANGPKENQHGGPSYSSCGLNGVDCNSPSGSSSPSSQTYPSEPSGSYSPGCGPSGCGSSSGGKPSYPSESNPACGPNGCGPKETYPSQQTNPSCGPNGCGPKETNPTQQTNPSCGPNGCGPKETYPTQQTIPACGPNGCVSKETYPSQPITPSEGTPQCGGSYGGSCSTQGNHPRPSTDLEVPFDKPTPGIQPGTSYEHKPIAPNHQTPTPYTPSSGSHSVPSNAIPNEGIHYTGPFPGPSGSIHHSKPVINPGSPGSTQPNLQHNPVVPSQQPYQPVSPVVTQPGLSVPTSPSYKPGGHAPNQLPDGGSHYTGSFPGSTGSIHESKPAGVKPGPSHGQAPHHHPVPIVPTYNPSTGYNPTTSSGQTPQHHPVPTVPSYNPGPSVTATSSATADAGVHYTGPFPGPSGPIHASKPATGTYHPSPTTAYSGTTAGTQYTGSTETKPVEATYTSPTNPSATSTTNYAGTTAGSTAGADAGVHYTGPFPGPTGSVHASKPAKGYNPPNQPIPTTPTQYPGSTANGGANTGAYPGSTGSVPTGEYTPQNQPSSSTQYSTSTANANAGANSGSYTGSYPGTTGSIHDSEPSHNKPGPTIPTQYPSSTANANAGAHARPNGSPQPSTGSYGPKGNPNGEVETDKPIIHIIPTAPSHESPKIDSNLVPGVTPEVSFAVSDVTAGAGSTASTGCSSGACGQGQTSSGCSGDHCVGRHSGSLPDGVTPQISFGVSGANAGSTAGTGCSNGNCGQGSYSGSQPTPGGSYSSGSKGGCGGVACGTGSQPIGVQIPGIGFSGSYSSSGASNGAIPGSHGCGPACAGLQGLGGLANAFSGAFAGSGSYSGAKGGSGAKSGAYANSGASSGSIGIPSGHIGGSFASSYASAGASAHAGDYVFSS